MEKDRQKRKHPGQFRALVTLSHVMIFETNVYFY